MNKKLVAVAVAGVLAAPLAAQAQNANVTLYGRLNLDLEAVSGRQADGSNPRVWRLSSNSSRLGVRGTEALGGGLSAIFQIESNVSGDTGNSSSSGFASRETFVGLQGNWGTFKMGKFLMPLDDMHPIFGNVPTFTTSILSTADLWAQGTLSKGAGGFDARLGNSLRYDSPVWSGFNFSTQIALRDSSGFADIAPPAGDNGEHTAELRHAYVWGAAGFYNNGPLQVGTAYERNVKVRGPDLSDWNWTITGAYNFGVIRPALVYERLDYDTPTGSLKRDFWGISATAPIGPGVLYAFYGDASNGKGDAATGTRIGGLTKGSDTGSKQWEISYSYPLSKRTTAYAGYVKLQNERNAAYTFNINAYTINTNCTGIGNAADLACGSNGKPDGFVFGLIHLF
jgi:predicted porin